MCIRDSYNIDLRVPIIIRSPDQKNRGVQTYALTELVDLFPTVCDLAGIEVPGYMQGVSLVPLIDNPDAKWKTAAFSQFHRRPKVSADGKRYMGYSINTKEYHYIEWYTWDDKLKTRGELKNVELFDRIKDPHEIRSIAQDESVADLRQELSKQLASGWRGAMPM